MVGHRQDRDRSSIALNASFWSRRVRLHTRRVSTARDPVTEPRHTHARLNDPAAREASRLQSAMATGKLCEDATLIDVLVDGFERNEVLRGFHDRVLPLPDEASAVRKFGSFVHEAVHWKGPPLRRDKDRRRRLAAWADLEIRQAGRGVTVRVKAPRFSDWWQDASTWAGDPLREIYEWLAEEAARAMPPDARTG